MNDRIKKSLTEIPATLTAVASYVRSIAQKQMTINKLKSETAAKVKKINDETKTKVDELSLERDSFFNAIFAFAKPKQSELTEKARTVKLVTGEFGWRWTTPKVDTEKTLTDAVLIARLQANPETEKYVRVIYEIDREAMLRDKPVVVGVAYRSRKASRC